MKTLDDLKREVFLETNGVCWDDLVKVIDHLHAQSRIVPDGCPPTEHDIFPHAEYLRAKPIETLLKQALDAMKSGNHNHIIGAITAIDKFLEEK